MGDRAATEKLTLLVAELGTDAVAFQGLIPTMTAWLDPVDAGAGLPYVDTGGAWVAAGGPVAPPGARADVAARFVAAARRAGRRALFFGVEDVSAFEGWCRLEVGTQTSVTPAGWTAAVRRKRSLREQLRRARAKGVACAVTPAGDLAPGTTLRARADALVRRWVASRRIEPMAFVVTPDPFNLPDAHRYVVATRGDSLVGLLSAIPAYAGRGWLVEHLVCAPEAPNGTSDSLLDALHRALLADGRGEDKVSLGLSPLSGGRARWQLLARALMRPLFDFDGLARFKARLASTEAHPVWLVAPAGASRVLAIVDVLAAFAGGSLVLFGVRSVLFHTRGLLWLLALGLIPWTLLLAWLDATHRSGLAGYSPAVLAAWITFDVVLATALFRAALRPTRGPLLGLIAAAACDAALSTLHMSVAGYGTTPGVTALRALTVIAPYIGAATLVAVTLRLAQDEGKGARRPLPLRT